YLDDLRRSAHQLRVAGTGPDSEYPPGTVQAALVRDFPLVEILAVGSEWNGDAIGGDDGFQVGADVPVQLFETGAQVPMIVEGQIARVGVQRKGAQGAGQARQLGK